MANFVYRKFVDALAKKLLDWEDDAVKAVLVTSAYTADQDADEFLSDIDAGARVATSNALANKTVAAGIFDADDAQFNAVSGAACNAYVLYFDTGSAGTSRLIAYFDDATGLPFTPSGAAFTLKFPAGTHKIFAIGYSN